MLYHARHQEFSMRYYGAIYSPEHRRGLARLCRYLPLVEFLTTGANVNATSQVFRHDVRGGHLDIINGIAVIAWLDFPLS
jgi:hypothetical protein